MTAAGQNIDGTREYVSEARWISGRPAVVQYSPEGPNHHRTTRVVVRVHDVATQSIYAVTETAPHPAGQQRRGRDRDRAQPLRASGPAVSKFAFGIALGAAFIVLLPLGPDPTPARAQTAGHAYEVLPGLQPDYENPGTLQEAAPPLFHLGRRHDDLRMAHYLPQP